MREEQKATIKQAIEAAARAAEQEPTPLPPQIVMNGGINIGQVVVADVYYACPMTRPPAPPKKR